MKKALFLPLLFLLLHAKAQDGTLDQTFGTGGFVNLGHTFTGSSIDGTLLPKAVFTAEGNLIGMEDGKIYRYNADGTSDDLFGSGGVVETSYGWDLGLQSDGKIVVVGDSIMNPFAINPPHFFVFARYNPDGTQDFSFGTNGLSLVLRGSTRLLELEGLFIANDNKIVYTTGQFGPGGRTYSVNRLAADGTALQSLPFTGLSSTISDAGVYKKPLSAAFPGNGDMLIGGFQTGVFPPNTIFSKILLIDKYKSDGTLDAAFGSGGFVASDLLMGITHLVVQNDGKILGSWDHQLLRLNPDCSIDNSFGSSGVINATFAINKILLQNDGKIIIGGTSDGNFALARFNPDGSVDPSFGSGGITISDFGGSEGIENMGIIGNRLYAYGSGIEAVYLLSPLCATPPTLRNDATIVLDADCSGKGGLVTLIPTSGTAPFMYSINGGATYVEGPATGYSFQELSAGTYQLRIKDARGCESAVITKEVHKYFGGPLFKNDGTIVLDASCSANDGNISIIPTCGVAPFQYSIDGGVTYVSGPATGYTFQNLAPGTYQLRLKDFYGTESAIVNRQVRPDFYGPCAINTVARSMGKEAQVRNASASLQAYPNPSKGRFQVQLPKLGTARVQLQVLSASGVLLQNRTVNAGQTNTFEINLTGKAKGLYLVKVVSEKGVQQTKVLIQ